MMKHKSQILLALASLALLALACNALAGVPSVSSNDNEAEPIVADTTEATDEPIVTEEPEAPAVGDVLLSDDFSSEDWGIGTDADSSVEYVDEALRFIVFAPNLIVWSGPNDEMYENVHLEVTILNNISDGTTAFGVMCNQQVTDVAYYFAITPAGEYAIAKQAVAQNDVFLTNDDQWGVSDLIPLNAESYRLGADCGNGTLTLYVDGQEIASVNDTTYTRGYISVFAMTDDEVITADVAFDDFLLTELP